MHLKYLKIDVMFIKLKIKNNNNSPTAIYLGFQTEINQYHLWLLIVCCCLLCKTIVCSN